MRRFGLVGLLVVGLLAAPAWAGEGASSIPDPLGGAKNVALQAVRNFCITWNLDELDELTAEDAAYEDRGPGSFKEDIQEIKKMTAQIKGQFQLSVREIVFFRKDDVAALRARCAQNSELAPKTDLWAPAALPAHIGDGVGCFVIAKEMRDNKEVDTEVYIFVVKKIQGEHKVVYFDNS